MSRAILTYCGDDAASLFPPRTEVWVPCRVDEDGLGFPRVLAKGSEAAAVVGYLRQADMEAELTPELAADEWQAARFTLGSLWAASSEDASAIYLREDSQTDCVLAELPEWYGLAEASGGG